MSKSIISKRRRRRLRARFLSRYFADRRYGEHLRAAERAERGRQFEADRAFAYQSAA